eukprot:c19145_g1_i1 orf=36-254(-)
MMFQQCFLPHAHLFWRRLLMKITLLTTRLLSQNINRSSFLKHFSMMIQCAVISKTCLMDLTQVYSILCDKSS